MNTVTMEHLKECAVKLGIDPEQSFEDLIFHIAWEQTNDEFIYQDGKGYYHASLINIV